MEQQLSAALANDFKVHLKIVPVNKQVSSSVLPGGTTVTYGSITTIPRRTTAAASSYIVNINR